MDDTWLSNLKQPDQTIKQLTTQAQTSLNLWHDLLKVSGRLLNPSKCVWQWFHWKFKPSDQAYLAHPCPTLPLLMSTPNPDPVPLHLSAPHEAHQYLGVQLTTDGNCKQELLFKQCNQQFLQLPHVLQRGQSNLLTMFSTYGNVPPPSNYNAHQMPVHNPSTCKSHIPYQTRLPMDFPLCHHICHCPVWQHWHASP